MVPESLAPMTISLNSESDTPAPSLLAFNPTRVNTCFDSQERAIPIGLTILLSKLIGGTSRRATRSAFVTPMLFGSSSTKNSVIVVRAIALQVSPLGPNTDAEIVVKIVVAVY